MATSTHQEKPKGNPNPSPSTRFGGERANPQSPGGWDKTQSISYQYNRLMRLPFEKLKTFEPETVAQKIALQRVMTAITSEGLYDTKEITDRTEGRAPQSVDITSGGETIQPILVEFISEKNTDTD